MTLCISDFLPIVVTECKTNVTSGRKEGFILAHSLRVRPIVMERVGGWGWAVDAIAFAVKNTGAQLLDFFLFSQWDGAAHI